MENNLSKPFFIYMAHFNVHSPYQGRTDYVNYYKDKIANDPDNKHRHPVMAAMVQSLDESIGKIMDKIDQLGIANNTILILMGDNGGVHWNNDNAYPSVNVTSNAPLRTGKSCFYEGGVRVPCLVKYTGKIAAGSTQNTPIHLIDFYPTLLEYAGTTPSAQKDVVDGVSIKSLLENTGAIAERPIFCHFPRRKQVGAPCGGSSVRKGDYKLYRFYDYLGDGVIKTELYNIANDISENNDIFGTQTAIENELNNLLDNWLTETGALIPQSNPNYTGGGGTPTTTAPTEVVTETNSSTSIVISWVDNSDDETEFIIERSPLATENWQQVGSAPMEHTEYEDGSLSPFTFYRYRVSAKFADETTETSDVAYGRTLDDAATNIPSPMQEANIGRVGTASKVLYSAGIFTVDAGDFDVWGSEDRFHFIYQEVQDVNFEVSVKLNSLSDVHDFAQGGVMIRESIDANAKQAFMMLAPGRGTILRDRVNTDGTTNQQPIANNNLTTPIWLKLTRENNVFTGYYSTNGTSWQTERSVTINMGNSVLVGMASASHISSVNCDIEYQDYLLNQSTGIASIRFEKVLDIYPNPVSDYLMVQLKNIDPVTMGIYNLSGQLIATYKVTNQTQRINISYIPAGVYFAKLMEYATNASKKLIVK